MAFFTTRDVANHRHQCTNYDYLTASYRGQSENRTRLNQLCSSHLRGEISDAEFDYCIGKLDAETNLYKGANKRRFIARYKTELQTMLHDASKTEIKRLAKHKYWSIVHAQERRNAKLRRPPRLYVYSDEEI